MVAMVTQLTGIRPEEFVSRFAEQVKQAQMKGRPGKQEVRSHTGQSQDKVTSRAGVCQCHLLFFKSF